MSNFGDYQTPERMKKKLASVPLPDLHGKSVLDVGCDHGFWCALALERGASNVVGLDRGREVRGEGFVNLAERNRIAIPRAGFIEMELGRQWTILQQEENRIWDVVLVLNVYHHIFNLCGDHESIWYWLYLHTAEELLWENPVSLQDSVAHKDIRPELHSAYNEETIRRHAEKYFDVETIGKGWTPTRVVWRCRPKALSTELHKGTVRSGAGGARKAFSYDDGRRIDEISVALGRRMCAGSLNVTLEKPFNFDRRYYRVQILDVKDRKKGVESEWAPRWCRFYPVLVSSPRAQANAYAYAMRFEGERYPETLVELISPQHLRSVLDLENGDEVCLFN
jgi:CTP-dependent riboflavin kinase